MKTRPTLSVFLFILLIGSITLRHPSPAFSQAHLPELLVDLTAKNLCPQLSNRFSTLTSKGTSMVQSADPAIGVMWIRECSAVEEAPEELTVRFQGSGWRWVERTSERLAAEFSIDEYVRFDFELTMVITPQIMYDPQKKVLTAWLLPRGPVNVSLTVKGDTEIKTETIWSSIVGGVAGIIGDSPQQRAEEAFKEEFRTTFESKIERGMTLQVDMCSGQYDLRFGTIPEDDVPRQIPAGSGIYLVNKHAKLHANSLLLSGPFLPGNGLNAEILMEKGAARIAWVCEDDAWRLAQAYLQGHSLPYVASVREDILSRGSYNVSTARNVGCSLVLVMRPADSTETLFQYIVRERGQTGQSFVPCPDSSKQNMLLPE